MSNKTLLLITFCLCFTFGQSLKAQLVITSAFVSIPRLNFSGPAKNEVIIDGVKNTVTIKGTVNKAYLIEDISKDNKIFKLKDYSNKYTMAFTKVDGADVLGFIDSKTEEIEYIFGIDGIITLRK